MGQWIDVGGVMGLDVLRFKELWSLEAVEYSKCVNFSVSGLGRVFLFVPLLRESVGILELCERAQCSLFHSDMFITWSRYECSFVQYLGSSFVLYVPSRLPPPF